MPDIVKAVASHDGLLWSTLGMRGLDVLAIFIALLVLRYVWVRSVSWLRMTVRRLRGDDHGSLDRSLRSSWLLTLGGVRGAITLAGVLSVPMLIAPGMDFPERDLLIFIAAGVILLSLITASIALPLLLRGVVKSPDHAMKREVQEAWKRTAEAAIHALEADDMTGSATPPDAAQAALVMEVKSRVMTEYRHQLEVFNDTTEAQALAWQMDQLERQLRLSALRAQRLELYRLSRQREIGDDVLRQILGELDLTEATLGVVK